jgi:Cu-Zn family superoxide dismutase
MLLLLCVVLLPLAQAYVQQAVCVLQPTATATTPIAGTVVFQNTSIDPVFQMTITVQASGLPPSSVLGFHVHQYGFIGTNDGTGAGGHFNPFNAPHAYPYTLPRYL